MPGTPASDRLVPAEWPISVANPFSLSDSAGCIIATTALSKLVHVYPSILINVWDLRAAVRPRKNPFPLDCESWLRTSSCSHCSREQLRHFRRG
jgi:hypothetical protein